MQKEIVHIGNKWKGSRVSIRIWEGFCLPTLTMVGSVDNIV